MVYAQTALAREVLHGLSRDDLRALARAQEWTTDGGGAAYATLVRGHLPTFTRSNADAPFDSEDVRTMREVREYLRTCRVLCIERDLCAREGWRFRCRLYVTDSKPHLGLLWHSSLYDPEGEREPDFVTIVVPEWNSRRILVNADEGITYVLGTDYFGETRHAFLRMAMHAARQDRGGLGLSAGAKLLRVRRGGRIEERTALFLGTAGTGKTALVCHPHELRQDESCEALEDECVLVTAGGEAVGTEDCFYVRTHGLSAAEQPLVHAATHRARVCFENVWVEPTRRIDYANTQLTQNGRALVPRRDFTAGAQDPDGRRPGMIFLLTRAATIMPPAAKLTAAQAAAAFMLGERVCEGDHGELAREAGMHPFILGKRAALGNRFLELLGRMPEVECYWLNTGRIGGPRGPKITLGDTQRLVRDIARGEVTWEYDPAWGYQVATAAPSLDLAALVAEKHYVPSELSAREAELCAERRAWMAQFDGLRPEIADAFA
jgi:phosphoenolpyruvate carboxykinase (ATP)